MKKLKINGLKLFKTLIKKNEAKKLELEVEGRVSLEQPKLKISEFDITEKTFEELGFKYVKTKPRKPRNNKKGNGD